MATEIHSNHSHHSDIDTLLSSSLQNPGLTDKFHIPRFRQRLAIVEAWGVQEKERILDIGCGQGESCLTLALRVGELGHVTGIDPAQPDYGHPFTMRQAHEHIQKSVLGPRITYYPVDTPGFLAQLDVQPSEIVNAAAMCQSLWYFPSSDIVRSLFTTLAQAKIPRLYLAEWSYKPSTESQAPHILAAKVQALLYQYRVPDVPGLREQNVRAGVDQESIMKAADEAGYRMVKENLVTPAEDNLEGYFELRFTLGGSFEKRVAEANLSESQEAEIQASLQQLRSEIDRLEANGVTPTSMDVWCAVLELRE